jgi:hypothetical protein
VQVRTCRRLRKAKKAINNNNIKQGITAMEENQSQCEEVKVEVIEEGPKLWNPNAAAWWGVVFTPIFSSYLVRQNWLALGRQKEADQAWYWMVGLFICYLIMPLFNFEGSIALALCVVWFIGYGRKQYKYVKDNLNNNYQRRPWGKALLSGVVIVAVVFAFNMMVQAFSDNVDIEGTAQVIVNEKIQERAKRHPDFKNFECVKVELGKEFAPDNYYATAILNTGEKLEITIQVKGDMVYVIFK